MTGSMRSLRIEIKWLRIISSIAADRLHAEPEDRNNDAMGIIDKGMNDRLHAEPEDRNHPQNPCLYTANQDRLHAEPEDRNITPKADAVTSVRQTPCGA